MIYKDTIDKSKSFGEQRPDYNGPKIMKFFVG